MDELQEQEHQRLKEKLIRLTTEFEATDNLIVLIACVEVIQEILILNNIEGFHLSGTFA